ncbi:MAG: hypothetical protein HY356_09220 [Gammaproteobacteria bacterium]|nr:hypothetical protein [Gammaproteobacteria bacterium]
MTYLKVFFTTILLAIPLAGFSENPVPVNLPMPELNKDSWLIVEIWLDVKDITFSAYFLDFSYEKNKSLCEAAKRVFDNYQETLSKNNGRKFSSYRLCMSVEDGKAQGYIRTQ